MSKAPAASRFASSFGLAEKTAAAPGARADDGGDKPKETEEEKQSRRAKERARKDGESDEDYAKRCAELDEKEKAEDDKDKKDAAAPAAVEPVQSPGQEDEQCAKARAEGVKAERNRWEMVLSDARCANKGLSACQLLATTDLSSAQILGVLDTVPAGIAAADPAKGLTARMAAEPKVEAPAPSAPAPNDARALAAQITRAAEQARSGKFE